MPRKDIYVPDDKKDIFEKATLLSGESCSKTIILALEKYINSHQIDAKMTIRAAQEQLEKLRRVLL